MKFSFKGVYVIENDSVDGQNHEVEFKSLSPYNSDDFSDGYIINAVKSSLYGQGRTHIVVTRPQPATHGKRGLTLNIMGSIVFKSWMNKMSDFL